MIDFFHFLFLFTSSSVVALIAFIQSVTYSSASLKVPPAAGTFQCFKKFWKVFLNPSIFQVEVYVNEVPEKYFTVPGLLLQSVNPLFMFPQQLSESNSLSGVSIDSSNTSGRSNIHYFIWRTIFETKLFSSQKWTTWPDHKNCIWDTAPERGTLTYSSHKISLAPFWLSLNFE